MAGWIITLPCRPYVNITTVWNANAYTSIADAVTNPTAGDGVTILADASDDSEAQSYGMSSPAAAKYLGKIDQIIVHVYGKKSSAAPQPTVNITVHGVASTAQNLALNISYAWTTYTFTGNWHRGGSEVGFVLTFTTGTMASADTVNIDVAYLILYGYPIPYII